VSSLHRIQWIDAAIRSGAYPNARRIAERFEISRRQALRDVEYLRDSLGAPIAYCAKRGGYCYTDDAFAVPGLYMAEAERESLAGLAAHYEALAGLDTRTSAAYGALAELLQRLAGEPSVPVRSDRIPGEGVVPFRAVLRPETAKRPRIGVPTPLKPFYRGQTDLHDDVFEFYDSYAFIPALLAAGPLYRIVHPNWLRDRLLQHLERMKAIYSG